MNMTLEDGQQSLSIDIPWLQRTRPGVGRGLDGKPMHAPSSVTGTPIVATSIPNHAVTKEPTMSNEARKQRLMHEILGDRDEEIPLAEIACLSIVVTVLVLFAAVTLSGCNWNDRKIVVVSTTDNVPTTMFDNSPAPSVQRLTANAEPDGKSRQQGDGSKKVDEGNVQDLTY